MFKNQSYLENKDSKYSDGETKKFKDYLEEHNVDIVVDFVSTSRGILFVMEHNNGEYGVIFDNSTNSKLSFSNLILLIYQAGIISEEKMRNARKS